MTLSMIMITKNAAAHLETALLAAKEISDEIVIVDCGSTDETRTIAKQFDAKIVMTNVWPGFGPQKNLALSHATGDWVLSLDADEVMSQALIDTIRTTLANPRYSAYAIWRRSFYCGQLIKYSGWQNDWVVRLFRRDSAQFSDDLVHEKLIFNPNTPTGKLSGALWHYSYDDFEQVLDKINHYSTLGAKGLFLQGKKPHVLQPFAHASFAFVRTYFLKRGFLDGAMGLALAISNAETAYYKYAKLRCLRRPP